MTYLALVGLLRVIHLVQELWVEHLVQGRQWAERDSTSWGEGGTVPHASEGLCSAEPLGMA